MSPSLPSAIGSLAFRGAASRVAALAYKIATAFRDTKTAMRFSRQLWVLDRTLKNLQGAFYQENPSAVPPPTNAELESGILAIINMQASFAELVGSFKAAGCYNNSLISAPLLSAVERIDDIAEFAYVVEVAINPQELAAIDRVYEEALDEYRRGETIPAENVFPPCP